MEGTGRKVAGALNWLLLALGIVAGLVGALMSVARQSRSSPRFGRRFSARPAKAQAGPSPS